MQHSLVGCSEMSVKKTTNPRCVKSQKGSQLIHTAAEAWNHAEGGRSYKGRSFWHPVLHLNLSPTSLILRQLCWVAWPIPASQISSARSHVPFTLLSSCARTCPCPRLFIPFRNMLIFLRQGVVSLSPKTQSGGPFIVGRPRLLFQYTGGPRLSDLRLSYNPLFRTL